MKTGIQKQHSKHNTCERNAIPHGATLSSRNDRISKKCCKRGMVNLYLASVRPSMVRLISIPSKHIEVSQESYLFAESD